jgi:hypothetical protein
MESEKALKQNMDTDDSRAPLKPGTRASRLSHQGINTADLGIDAWHIWVFLTPQTPETPETLLYP